MEKKARSLGMGAKQMMTVAEKLYSAGYISYPRTETNIFSKSIDLKNLVKELMKDRDLKTFCETILKDGPNPNNGKKNDEAHPPIHPLKIGTDLEGYEAKVYDFITRRFLGKNFLIFFRWLSSKK